MPVPRDSRESNPQADKSVKSKARVEETNKTRLAEEANGSYTAKREPDTKRTQELKEQPRSGSGTKSESTTTQREATTTPHAETPTQRESTPVQRESTLAQNSGTSRQREVLPSQLESTPSPREGRSTHRESLPTQQRVDAPAQQEFAATQRNGGSAQYLETRGAVGPHNEDDANRDAHSRREGLSAQPDKTTEAHAVTQIQREISIKNPATGNDVSYTRTEENVIPPIKRDLAKTDSPQKEAHSETQDPTHRRTSRQHSAPEDLTGQDHHKSSTQKTLRGQVEYLSAPDKHTSKSSTHEIASEFQDNRRSHIPYPGERGVVRFLDLLPEDVRHHIRWQSSPVAGNANVHSTHTKHSPAAVHSPAASPSQTSPQRALAPTTSQDTKNAIQNTSETINIRRIQVTSSKESSFPTTPPPNRAKNFKSSKFIGEKRYITGVEIALAAIVSAAGIARNRSPLAPKGEAHTSELLTNVAPTNRIQTSSKSDTRSSNTEMSTLVQSANNQQKVPLDKATVSEKSAENTGSPALSSVNSDKVVADGKRIALDRIDHSIASHDQSEDREPHSGRKIVRTLQKASSDLFGRSSEPKLFAVSSGDVSKGSIENIAIVPSTEEEQLATYAQDVTRSRPKTLISLHDTLVSIAEAFYHDATLGWLIADLNSNWSKEMWVDGKRIVEFKNRQQVVLPLWEDVMCFHSRRPSNAEPENLVTVVVETAIDRELLDSQLSTVIGGVDPKSKKRKPIKKDFN